MWLYVFVPLLACLNTVFSRDVGRTLKTVPYITNSLVNLGKMDVSFHFNGHPDDFASRSDVISHGSSSLFSPKTESLIEEPCPCTSLTYPTDSSQNHPTELLNRLLSGNDLFSFKEPTSSPLCCDSHERVQEDILLEFGPKRNQVTANQQTPNLFPFLPFLLEGFKNRGLPTVKPKTVEIFFFPKKRGIKPQTFEKSTGKKDEDIKKDIKIVGDKMPRNDFKNLSFITAAPSSVKKDLALQEKNKYETQKVDEVIVTATDRHLNIIK